MNASALVMEQNVIGSVLCEPSVIAQCEIAADDFSQARHRAIWSAVAALQVRGIAVDVVTVAEQLDRTQQLASSGGIEYLAALARETAEPRHGATYAARLREHSQVRRVRAIAAKLSKLDTVVDLEQHLAELIALTATSKTHACHLSEAMGAAIELLDAGSTGVPTGLRDLDGALGGWHDGDLVVVGARPAMGKTAFMLNVALAANVPVGVVSAEQARDQIGLRTIAITNEVSLHRMRTGAVGDDDWMRITDALNSVKNKNVWLYDKPAPMIAEVASQARRWKYENKIGLLLIDYLQKVQGGRGDNFRLQVGDVIARLKDLARELKIPVIAFAQVKREVESRDLDADGLGRMPYMADIAECSIVEQEADVVITLYRPEVYTDDQQFRGLAYANICKNRHGPTGHKRFAWRGEFLRFENIA